MTSLGMHRGLHGGSDGAEIRCHWEQLDGLFHHLPQSQSGPTQSEGSAQMSEEIISGGTYPTAHRPPPPTPLWAFFSLALGILFPRGSKEQG